jgi:tripartite-type tricarboxylate transporter receptor subunit TctC
MKTTVKQSARKLAAMSALGAALIGTLTMTAATAFAADAYPGSTPIRLVLPYPPGGGIDAVGRPLADQLSRLLGQTVFVENRGGANGSIGMDYVARATPDGHTIVLALDSQLSINPNIYNSLQYDPVKDFAPVTLIGTVPYILTVNPDLPIKSVNDLLAYAKNSKKSLNYASSGVGSGAHLATALLESMAKVTFFHIPNKSTSSSMRDVVVNDAQLVFVTYGAAGGLIQAGKLRPIGVTGSSRMPVLPDVPPISDSIPGYETGVSYGILAPAGTPAAIVNRLNSEIGKILKSESYQHSVAAVGVQVKGSTPEEFSTWIKTDLAKWAKIVREGNIPKN